jgi:hypothetical protein
MNAKVAVIIGHPGHELRIHRFMELYKPLVYVLTDGSGSSGTSRVYNTIKIIEQTNSRKSAIMGRFTDTEIYKIIREQDTETLRSIVDEIVFDLEKNDIDLIVGDAIEGYNPTHDLCRYMINAIVRIYRHKRGTQIPNYDFLLDGPPHLCPPELKEEAIWVKLNDEDFDRKFAAAQNYPEIIKDLEIALSQHGKAPFQIECLRPVKNLNQYVTWNSEMPYYESYGLNKVKTGEYTEVISFEKHLLPLGEFLSNYSEELIKKA